MRRLTPLFVTLLLGLTAGPAPSAAAPAVVWRGWDRGLEEARATDRPVLLNVVTSWCGYCKRMDAEVYGRPEVREYLSRRFVTVRIDAESAAPARYEGKALTSRSLAARFGVSGYPTTVFLRSSGDHPLSVPGYVDAPRFLQILRYIGEGHVEAGVSFQDFQKREAARGATKP